MPESSPTYTMHRRSPVRIEFCRGRASPRWMNTPFATASDHLLLVSIQRLLQKVDGCVLVGARAVHRHGDRLVAFDRSGDPTVNVLEHIALLADIRQLFGLRWDKRGITVRDNLD